MTPDQMTAIAVEGGKGPPEALKPQRTETPRPAQGQILIRVRAAGVNRPDLMQRQGYYPPPPGAPPTLGLEVAGEVAEVGPGAARWAVGDAVTALLGGGGYAEYAVVDSRHALPIPERIGCDEAARDESITNSQRGLCGWRHRPKPTHTASQIENTSHHHQPAAKHQASQAGATQIVQRDKAGG